MAKHRKKGAGPASIGDDTAHRASDPRPHQPQENARDAPAAGGAPQMAADTAAGDVDRERVARRAYELFLARGGSDGQAMEDWLNAEREMRHPASRDDQR